MKDLTQRNENRSNQFLRSFMSKVYAIALLIKDEFTWKNGEKTIYQVQVRQCIKNLIRWKEKR